MRRLRLISTRRMELAFCVGVLGVITLIQWQVAAGRDRERAGIAKAMLDAAATGSGLCIHLGLQDSQLTTQLSAEGRFLVHGLSSERQVVDRVRDDIHRQGFSGIVSVELGSFEHLPYARNLANLLVVEDFQQLVAQGLRLKEVLRVVRPEGMVYLGMPEEAGQPALAHEAIRAQLAEAGAEAIDLITDQPQWVALRKPRELGMDAWTHRRYDPTGNRVSDDTTVGIPSGVRWMAGPQWPTGNRKAAVPAVVTSKNDLVYVFDDEVSSPPRRQNTLVSRDAFNGILRWKRETKSGNNSVLVCLPDRIYTVVADGGPLVALDPSTGATIQSYPQAGAPQELLCLDGALIVQAATQVKKLDAGSGEVIWANAEAGTDLVIGQGQIFCQSSGRLPDGKRTYVVKCLDLESGNEVWQSGSHDWPKNPGGLNLVLYQDGILVLAGSKATHAISAKDGSYLWEYTYPLIGHGGSYAKVLYVDGLLWIHSGGSAKRKQYAWEGLNPQTGKVERTILQPSEFVYKHRCNTDTATGRYFLCGSMDFVDLEKGEYEHFVAARNSCRTAGTFPANGLVYTFPHGCACYPLLRGFLGLAEKPAIQNNGFASRLEKGAAYDAGLKAVAALDTDWPTYRHDAMRSASSVARGPRRLDMIWERQIAERSQAALAADWEDKDGSQMSSSTIAHGLIYVAATDAHRVYALDANDGKVRWTFTAGGRVDCPPTIHRGLCLLGCRDGWVYCLTADHGELVWRFRAAADPQRIVAYGQLESPTPILGGVLVHDELAYFVAGRHSGADGGIQIYAAQPKTGEIVWQNNIEGYRGLPDILVADSVGVHMSDWQLDAKTGKSRNNNSRDHLRAARLGLLSDAWYKRPLALRKHLQQWSVGSEAGQLLCFNQRGVCGFKAPTTVGGSDGKLTGDSQLYAKGDGGGWSIQLPTQARIKGMVMAGRTVYVAGKRDAGQPGSSMVWSYSREKGDLLGQYQVGQPLIHDCLSVAGRRLYLSTRSGQLLCLGEGGRAGG